MVCDNTDGGQAHDLDQSPSKVAAGSSSSERAIATAEDQVDHGGGVYRSTSLAKREC